jgi:hypothetical protein
MQQVSSTQLPEKQSVGTSQPAPFGAGVRVGVTVDVWDGDPVAVGVRVGVELGVLVGVEEGVGVDVSVCVGV